VSFAGARRTPLFAKFYLQDVVLFLFRAHGKQCRCDDHSEKYQCKDKIMDHWGSLLFWRLLPSLSNHVPGDSKVTSHDRGGGYHESCKRDNYRMFLEKQ